MIDIKKTVYYIGYNTNYGNPNVFKEFPSCNSKMEYIIQKLQDLGCNIHILSLGQGLVWKRTKSYRYGKNKKVTYVGTIPNKSFLRLFSKLYLLFEILYFVLFRVPRESKIIIYHSTFLPYLFKIIKKIKVVEIIYEVEEIYAAAWGRDEDTIKKEIRSLSFADKYILVNDILPTKLNLSKPYVVCYGSYEAIKSTHRKEETGFINIVYAGVIGNIDSDVYLAINAMEFLPLNYRLKVVGYGSERDISVFKKYIEKKNNVIYDGLLKGEEYSDYLLNCDIGLCPRRLDNKLSDYTFPSKVLVYLGHSLQTVTTRIDCIIKSEINNLVYYIDDLDGKSLADAIVSIDLVKNETLVKLNELDSNFKNKLKDLLL